MLVLSDYRDISVARPLPLHRERVDVLLMLDGRLPWYPRTSLIYVTRQDAQPIPTDHVLGDGGAHHFATSVAYDLVYVDEMVFPETLVQLAHQSRCPVPTTIGEGEYLLLPTRCLPSGELRFDDVSLSFAVP